jgi:APA family basic amino acid/polyamine antiporter
VLGIGVTIGAGISVLAGVAAATKAGPAISLSFVLAAVVCALGALCYAEFAALAPVAGSAYTYSYATLGQLVAFIIGWDLVLEFTIGASAVAVGFAGYLNSLLDQLFGVTIPQAMPRRPAAAGRSTSSASRSCCWSGSSSSAASA